MTSIPYPPPVIVGVALVLLGLAVAVGALPASPPVVAAVVLGTAVALARHRPGEHRPGVPISPDRTPRPARHSQEEPVAVNWSNNMSRLDPETRKASKNKRAGTERRASGELYELHAERRSPMPWAAPGRQRIPVSGKDRRKVTRQLERDGWTVHCRKARRGWFW